MEGILISSSPLRFQPLRTSQRIATIAKRRKQTTVCCDYYYKGGKLVDENMVVLRKRIHEMKMVERNYEPPTHWMQWEKRIYCGYDATICDALCILQTSLMNSRPSVAFGTLLLILVSVPVSTAFFAFRILDILLWLVNAIQVA
ncbi:Mediator of RNA polymerase II transcription subunit [Hirschfeldia incana]|nr:Mediator of RNA polymerase II transcription subunit [Hirschfeldia incana]